jgi:proteasome alpha subunit
MMGYDRAITMFSPDGRLLQVEYARKMVRQGSTAIGIVCRDGVLLVADKRLVDRLIVPESVEKIWKIDDHIGATASGMISDARVLIERAQIKAQQNRVTYDSPIDVLSIVKDICDLKQLCTQSGGLRPFGVSALIIGIDENGAVLYETDPAGIYFRYKAKAIGDVEPEVEEILYTEYKDNMSIEEGFELAINALYKTLGKDLNLERLDAAYIKTSDKQFVKLNPDQLDRVLKNVKKVKK